MRARVIGLRDGGIQPERSRGRHHAAWPRRPGGHRYRSRMDLSLFFAGTGGSVPSARRGLPAVLVRYGGERLLFDCGEGTQRQLMRSVGLVDLDCVFITHFHADHWLGLPGMLKSFALREREHPLTIYGPEGLSGLMAAMRIVYGRLPYEMSVVELARWDVVDRRGYQISAVPVKHGDRPSYGYALIEDPRPGEFDPRLAEELGVSPGPDFGRLQGGETVAGVKPATRSNRPARAMGQSPECDGFADPIMVRAFPAMSPARSDPASKPGPCACRP